MTGPCTECGKPGRREVIAGNLCIYICDACDEAAEADWQGAVANIVEKMNRGDFD